MASPGHPGTPSKATPENIAKAMAYVDHGWQDEDDAYPMVEGMAIYVGCSKDTLYANEQFSDAIKACKVKQGRILQNQSVRGKFNPIISKLVLATNHGFHEKSEVKQESKLELTGGQFNQELADKFTKTMKEQ
jgi:hypothetical protein